MTVGKKQWVKLNPVTHVSLFVVTCQFYTKRKAERMYHQSWKWAV